MCKKCLKATIFTLILCLSFCFGLSGCTPSPEREESGPSGPDGGLGGPSGPSVQPEPDPPSLGDDYSGEGDKIADFSLGMSDAFYASDGWSNGGMFDCVWSASNVRQNGAEGSLELWLTQDGRGNLGAEYRSRAHYGFGYYSVCMKAVKKAGVVSSFFTYTGPSEHNPWDEIDIEFLGNDTTRVQFNYYTNGVGEHEYLYDLGFDASEAFHEYAFLWTAGSITWYVDGTPVYRAEENIPQTPGRIMINAWQGKPEEVGDWSGVFDGVYPVAPAAYKWIGFKAA